MNKLTLVIPVYNGAKILPKTFKELVAFFSSRVYLEEVIFVNDCSADDTKDLIESFIATAPFSVRVINKTKNGGKGGAIYTGISAVQTSAYTFFCDDDIPFGLEPLEKMYQILEADESIGIVTADRSLVNQNSPYPLHRRIGSFCYGLLLPRFIGKKFPDMHGGTKGFRTAVAKQIFSHIKNFRWSFDPEIFLIADANNIKVGRVPVRFMPHVTGTRFRLKDFVTVGTEILRMHYNSIFGSYKLR